MDQWEAEWRSGSVCMCMFHVWVPDLKSQQRTGWHLNVDFQKYWKSEKNPQDIRILVRGFSDLQNSTFKYLYRPCKVLPLSPARCSHVYLHSKGRKNRKRWYFENLKIPLVSTSSGHEKRRRFFCLGALTDPHSYRRKKSALHTACKGTYGTSGILEIQKKCQNPEISQKF